jgi:hypothetical protein
MNENELRERVESTLDWMEKTNFEMVNDMAPHVRAYIDHLNAKYEATLKLAENLARHAERLCEDREAHGRAAWEAAREDMAPVGSFFHGTYDEWQAAEQRKDKELGEG